MEIHTRTAAWFWDQEIFDWIGSCLHLIERPSMRHYLAACELKQAVMDWRVGLLERWLSGPRLLAARLQADTSFATEEDRARAFVAQGGGCRATYFNHTRKLRPAVEPPRIVLTASAPAQDSEKPLDLLDLLRQRHGGLGHG